MKTLLITGINGIIGQILKPHLEKKYEVYGMDSQGPFDQKTIPVDTGNFDQLASLQDNLPKIDTVIHLAAASDHLAPWETVLKNNIVGTRNVFELAHLSGVKRVVFASSTHAFGKLPDYPNIDFPNLPNSPNLPYSPDSFYGASKAYGETLARYYFEEHNLNFTIIRIGSVNKEDRPTKGFEMIHLYHKDLIKMIEEAIEDTAPFKTIWGVSKPDSA